MIVKILGSKWTIKKKKYKEDPYFDRNSWDGYCDGELREILVCDLTTWPGWENETEERVRICEKKTLRHEVVHAYLDECGLDENALKSPGAWPKNEEMVDWIAKLGPQIYKTWQEVDAL